MFDYLKCYKNTSTEHVAALFFGKDVVLEGLLKKWVNLSVLSIVGLVAANSAAAADCSDLDAATNEAWLKYEEAEEEFIDFQDQYNDMYTNIINVHYIIVQACGTNYVCVEEADIGKSDLISELDQQYLALSDAVENARRKYIDANVAFMSAGC